MQQILKLVLEFGPLVIFFVTNSKFGIFHATAAFMVAITLSLVISKLVFKKIAVMALFTGVFVLVFGALTLYLNDETFIKVKPTIVNLLFAFILLAGLYKGRIFLKYVFEEAFHLKEEGWRQLTIRWGLFFIALAVLNEFVWRNFSTDDWVSFKVFGIMPITMIFGLFQIGLLQKYQIEEKEDTNI